MKKFQHHLLAGCLSLGSLSHGIAQDKSSIPLNRKSVQTKDIQIICQTVGITDRESQDFLPLYNQYHRELNDLQKKNSALLTISNEEITDDEAWLTLDGMLKLEREKVNLRKKYANRFRMVLPPKKAASYFLLESKMDAVLNYDLEGIAMKSDKNK